MSIRISLLKEKKTTISLNTHNLILLKNPLDISKIAILGCQIFPTDTQYINEPFKDAM